MQTLSKTVHPSSCTSIGCNILVYDTDEDALALIRSIAAEGNLVVPKKGISDVSELLSRAEFYHPDICAIFLTEELDENGLSGFDIAMQIHQSRTNVPIFMRLLPGRGINDLNVDQRRRIASCYSTSEPEKLKNYTDKFLYGFYFPNALVDIFVKTGATVLSATFKGCEIRESKPYLVYDHLITTEYTSLLPVQFTFGNGILTFHIKEEDAIALIANEHTALSSTQTTNDCLNQLISEVMNQYWGKVRYECESQYSKEEQRNPVSIPIVVNHKQNYINFGNHTPQLCFRYILLRDSSLPQPIIVEFKMMFNSVLRPSDFPERNDSKSEIDDSDYFELF
ncbi:chemotaxis phosphatase CheX-like protein [Alteromonadaceae bacterium 2753L.S.0a.02]|nr:chemotaxis phosphatase CheX-like protein [Alteromonadaceae bacterium 2753L.S.0a.02]